MASTIAIALLCLAAGAAIGALFIRFVHPDAKERRELEARVKTVENEYKAYQQEVAEHFLKSSELINNISLSYRNLYEHMASSAIHLANPEISRKLLDAGDSRLHSSDRTDQRLPVTRLPNPPKDYAPKVPGGVLSEQYGLMDETDQRPGPSLRMVDGIQELYDPENEDNDDPTLKVG